MEENANGWIEPEPESIESFEEPRWEEPEPETIESFEEPHWEEPESLEYEENINAGWVENEMEPEIEYEEKVSSGWMENSDARVHSIPKKICTNNSHCHGNLRSKLCQIGQSLSIVCQKICKFLRISALKQKKDLKLCFFQGKNQRCVFIRDIKIINGNPNYSEKGWCGSDTCRQAPDCRKIGSSCFYDVDKCINGICIYQEILRCV